ncbi:DUF3175 domain-containing protein [Uliginosibacterium sp. H3]|uniref:DUF3175 domain-containing protein n=1 Tax=Uliginosibacterium silvisoli TaxID=3114758 RepID=A0ABU6JXR3_9RHOO|nr:DUF3175 domain-containing protein [Uliginosibacterium sp. H3]
MPQQRTRRGQQAVAGRVEALDTEHSLFAQTDPRRIAQALKHASPGESRESASFRAAMSRLKVYMDRAGDALSASQRRRLEAVEGELRTLFNRPERIVH